MTGLPTIATVAVGDELPTRDHSPSNVTLFLYNAAVWNPHRIHYDSDYTTGVEHHPGIVVDGPLQGDWLSQVALNWVGDAGRLVEFGYSNRVASHLGETLTSGGRVVVNDDVVRALRVTPQQLREAAEREGRELQRREAAYRGGRAPLELAGRTVILVDDGLATGASMFAAVQALRSKRPTGRCMPRKQVGGNIRPDGQIKLRIPAFCRVRL